MCNRWLINIEVRLWCIDIRGAVRALSRVRQSSARHDLETNTSLWLCWRGLRQQTRDSYVNYYTLWLRGATTTTPNTTKNVKRQKIGMNLLWPYMIALISWQVHTYIECSIVCVPCFRESTLRALAFRTGPWTQSLPPLSLHRCSTRIVPECLLSAVGDPSHHSAALPLWCVFLAARIFVFSDFMYLRKYICCIVLEICKHISLLSIIIHERMYTWVSHFFLVSKMFSINMQWLCWVFSYVKNGNQKNHIWNMFFT